MEKAEIDWWHLGAVAALALIAIADIAVPARMLSPIATAGDRLAEGEVTTERITAALPSMAWPGLALALGLSVVGVGVWRMFVERSVEGRWLWVVAVAAAMVMWSAGVIAALSKAQHTIARMTGSL